MLLRTRNISDKSYTEYQNTHFTLNIFFPENRAVEETLWGKKYGSARHAANDNIINPYPTAFPYGNGMVLHFYQQQESSTTKTVHKVINKGLKTYV